MNTPAIELTGAGKRYWKLVERSGLRSVLPFSPRSRTELWSVRNIDLRVQRGETLGVLGRNGSGKTTLLKMLCGVTDPTEGKVRVMGRIAPLIGVGVGFHAEMTGRENVLLNGLLLGLTEEQIADRLDDIVAFAELATFIDTPVKFYSSGMFVRLGFSVAVHSDPEVLLVDEVLAVGDLSYQMKCVERMQELRAGGTTVVFVSHSIDAVRVTCPRVIVLNRGRLEHDGDPDEGIARYHQLLSDPDQPVDEEAVRAGQARRISGGATIVEHELLGPDGPGTYFPRDVPLVYRVRVRFDRPSAHPMFGMNVLGQDGRAAYGVHSPVGMKHRVFRAGEETEVEFRLMNRLGGGSYRATTAVISADARETLAEEATGIMFYVEPVAHSYGAADLSGIVAVDGEELREDRSFLIGGEPSA